MEEKEELKREVRKLREEVKELKENTSNEKKKIEKNDQKPVSRRLFLKTLAGGAVGLGAMATLPSASAFQIKSQQPFSYFKGQSQKLQVSESGVLNVNQIGSNSSPVELAHFKNLKTEEVNNIKFLRTGQNPADVINNTSPGDTVILEPGNRFEIEETLKPAKWSFIINLGGSSHWQGGQTNFLRKFDGPLIEYPSGLTMVGVNISGNSQNNYSGDILVSGEAGNLRLQLLYCHAKRVDGDFLKADGLHHANISGCEISDGTGYGIRIESSTNVETSSITVEGQTRIAKFDEGGVLLDDDVGHDLTLEAIIESNGGPGIEIKEWDRSLRIRELIGNNDGPGLYINSESLIKNVDVSASLIDNNQNPEKPETSKKGEIQVEGSGNALDPLSFSGYAGAPNQYSNYVINVKNTNLVNIQIDGIKYEPSEFEKLVSGGGNGSNQTLVTSNGTRTVSSDLIENARGLIVNSNGMKVEEVNTGATWFFENGEFKARDSEGNTKTLT